MHASVNGVAIVDLRLTLPRGGVWSGELSAEADAPLDFALELELGGMPFKGTARTSSLTSGTAVAEFVGGVAGLSRPIAAKSYNSVPLTIPLQDIIGASGEKLSPYCSQEVLNLQLNAWTIVANKAGSALNSLARIAPAAAGMKDVVWRMQPDGTLWLGVETWEEVEPPFELLLEDPLADRLVLYMENPGILPGTTFGGRRVSLVQHTIKDSKLRTAVWFE